MEYHTIEEIRRADGLRLVLVQGFPSPWGQAAKAMMEHKGLTFRVGPQAAGGENPDLVSWAGINSGPVVAWQDEPPVNRWNEIVLLLERLAPEAPLVPDDASLRAQVFGLGHEICGPLGLGWNRRLDMFRPAMESDEPPAAITSMAAKWGYFPTDVAAANRRTVATLGLLAETLKTQRARGSQYFVGDVLTAVDFWWTAFSNMVDLMPPELCPLDPSLRPLFENVPDVVVDAIDPVLIEHRDRIMRAHFVVPMEL